MIKRYYNRKSLDKVQNTSSTSTNISIGSSLFSYNPILLISKFTSLINYLYISQLSRQLSSGITLALALTLNDNTTVSLSSTTTILPNNIVSLLSSFPSSLYYNTNNITTINESLQLLWLRYSIVLSFIIYTGIYHIFINIWDTLLYSTTLGKYLRNTIDTTLPSQIETIIPNDQVNEPIENNEEVISEMEVSENSTITSIYDDTKQTVLPEASPSVESTTKPSIQIIEPNIFQSPVLKSKQRRNNQQRIILASPDEIDNDQAIPNIGIPNTSTINNHTNIVPIDITDSESNGTISSNEVSEEEENENDTGNPSSRTTNNNTSMITPSIWNNYIQSLSSLSTSIGTVSSSTNTVPILHAVPDPTGKAPFILVPLP